LNDQENCAQTIPNPHVEDFVRRIRSGEVRALSRAISTVEDHTPESTELLKALFPYSGNAVLLGLTGSPGAGKSTLVDQIAHAYRKQGKTIGIVAVDPTSPFSGGAILGDAFACSRIMPIRHLHSQHGYARLSRWTGQHHADVATVLDASGRDLVMIETVGVGQDEIDIVRLADVTIVVLVPGMGDDVQTIKAGIMEIADIFVINKSDREGANAWSARFAPCKLWHPPRRLDSAIVKTVASDGQASPNCCRPSSAIANILPAATAPHSPYRNWRNRIAQMLRDALFQRILSYYLSEGEATRFATELPSTNAIRILW